LRGETETARGQPFIKRRLKIVLPCRSHKH
jgi:hypothetical protein